MSPEEPLVIGRTGEMDRLHNPYTPLYSYLCMFMFTLYPPKDSADPTPLRDGWDCEKY